MLYWARNNYANQNILVQQAPYLNDKNRTVRLKTSRTDLVMHHVISGCSIYQSYVTTNRKLWPLIILLNFYIHLLWNKSLYHRFDRKLFCYEHTPSALLFIWCHCSVAWGIFVQTKQVECSCLIKSPLLVRGNSCLREYEREVLECTCIMDISCTASWLTWCVSSLIDIHPPNASQAFKGLLKTKGIVGKIGGFYFALWKKIDQMIVIPCNLIAWHWKNSNTTDQANGKSCNKISWQRKIVNNNYLLHCSSKQNGENDWNFM